MCGHTVAVWKCRNAVLVVLKLFPFLLHHFRRPLVLDAEIEHLIPASITCIASKVAADTDLLRDDLEFVVLPVVVSRLEGRYLNTS